MYKNFFGLHENPFSLSPDPRFLFLTPQIQEATEQLTYGVSSRKGLILLTGEVGTGNRVPPAGTVAVLGKTVMNLRLQNEKA